MGEVESRRGLVSKARALVSEFKVSVPWEKYQ